MHSFSSVWYAGSTVLGRACAFWMADSEKGMVRVSADGSVVGSFSEPPVDMADNSTARLTGMAGAENAASAPVDDSALVLLDTSSPVTTKLWRFLPDNQSFVLLNTSGADLGPNITGVALDVVDNAIYLSDTRTRRVIRLLPSGELDSSFDTSGVGLVEPAGLASLPREFGIFVADSGYNGTGALIALASNAQTYYTILPENTTPPMFRPLSVAYDGGTRLMYAADSNGYVFQFALVDFKQQAAHRPVPTASHIVSMTANADSYLYMLDAYSRRLIILSWDSKWELGDDCARSILPSSSSTASSSSSSTAPSLPVPRQLWSAAAIAGIVVAAVGVVAALVGASGWYYMTWKRRQGGGGRSKGAGERLMAEHEQKEDEWEENDGEATDDDEAVEDTTERMVSPVGAETSMADGEHKSEEPALLAPLDRPSRLSVDVDVGEERHAADRRYDYYVQRYEVVAVVGDMQQLGERRQWEESGASTGQLLSIQTSHNTLQLPFQTSHKTAHRSPSTATTGSAKSHSSDTSSSTSSSSSSTSSSDYLPSTPSRPFDAATATSASGASSAAAVQSPLHITALQSAWPRTNVTFIDTVTDLSILGEGSSGVVYRGVYRGMACVVKLPKAVSLTGAAWREWQCHLCLPPHPNLVRFLGALPMSSTNYLVLGFVRQGSLHSLLRHAWYSRPYAVMRCMRDVCAALRHIHVAGIVHRDVSCRNILVDSDGSMVLADLGLATQLSAPDESMLQTAVPVRWTSPESLADSTYSSKSDVWSLGVALWEMTKQGALPYGQQQRNTKQCIRPIIARQLTLQVDEQWGRADDMSRAEWQLADRVRQLIQLCLTYDVEQRPDSEQLAEMAKRCWEEWQAAAGSEADQLERAWRSYHVDLQQRLGPPTSHQQPVIA